MWTVKAKLQSIFSIRCSQYVSGLYEGPRVQWQLFCRPSNLEPFSPIIWCIIQTWILFTSELKCTDNMQTLDLSWIMYAESKCGNSMIATKRCKLNTKRRRSTNYGGRFIKCTLLRFMTSDQHGVLWFYETKKWLIAGSFDEELPRYKAVHIWDKTSGKNKKRSLRRSSMGPGYKLELQNWNE